MSWQTIPELVLSTAEAGGGAPAGGGRGQAEEFGRNRGGQPSGRR